MNKNMTSVVLDTQYGHPQWLANKLGGATSVSFDADLPTMDDGIAFYVSQLAHIETTLYKTPYAAIDYADLIPPVQGIPEWADEWTYISYDGVTMGKFIGSSAKDLPRVTVSANKSRVNIGYAGVGYDYSIDASIGFGKIQVDESNYSPVFNRRFYTASDDYASATRKVRIHIVLMSGSVEVMTV